MQDEVLQLALQHRLINQKQIEECRNLARKIARHGIQPKPLLTLMQLKGYLHPVEIEGLLQAVKEQARQHKVPEDEYRLAEKAVRRGFTTVERVVECVRTREQFIKLGLGSKSLIELLVHNRYLTESQVTLLKRQA